MPSIGDIMEKFHSSTPAAWRYQEPGFGLFDTEFREHPTWVYENDVELRIERGGVAVDDFKEEWSEKVPDTDHNRSVVHWLIYNRSPIKRYLGVQVDGGRAMIPLPDRPDKEDGVWSITERQHKFGRIINRDRQGYENTLDMCDIEVE